MILNVSRASSFLVKNICKKEIRNLEIHSERKYGFIGKLLNVKNEVITFSINGKKERFESKNIFSLIDSAVKGSDKTKWFKEETTSILSSEVNKTIDAACENHGFFINKKEKDDIFRKISSGFAPVKLDPKCTQSSISHILYNDKFLSKRIERLFVSSQYRDEKNKLRNIVNSRLTDQVFVKKFGGIDLNLLRQKTAEEIVRLVKLKNYK